MLKYFTLLLILLVVGCTQPFNRAPLAAPSGAHNPAADRDFCRDYAERYGVINLGPMMGDSAQNRPDRERRNHLFLFCMEDKGYRF